MCVGMGSQLFTKEIIAEKNWTLLEKNVVEALDIVKKLRS
jgi:2-dehydro-3-deoxyphosphogluconate aldolase/(4S)-4-hydroxy-2-oxoglutarate aldolase